MGLSFIFSFSKSYSNAGLELFASTIKLVECCIFYMEKVDEGASLEFEWLKKRGVGGKKKEVQFYGSFKYDGVKYELYDCVYMYKEGLQEPYIGKLTKIWENADKSKKVKVHWFFRPEEISKWLGDIKTLENEILFASGEGVGLANISPLEAIAGKCNVVCVSKDSRNPQPSDDQLKAADFVFHRTFDVESCTILDRMDEKVGGIEIKYIFNRREDESISTLPETTSHKKEENHNTITVTCSEQQQPLTKTVIPNNLKDDTKDAQDKDTPNLVAETPPVQKIDENADKVEANKRKKTPTGSDKLHDQPLKKMKLDDKNPPKEKQLELEAERLTDIPSKKSKVDSSKKSPVDHVNNLKADKNSEMSKSDKADKDETKVSKVPVDKERKKTRMESDKLDDRPLKKMKSPPHEKQVEVEGENIERLTDLPSKKSKVDSKPKDEDKLVRNVSNLKASGTSEEKPNVKNDKGKISDESESRILKKTKGEGSIIKKNNSAINANGSNGKNLVTTEGKLKSDVVGSNNKDDQLSKKKLSLKDMYQEFVVTPKPNADKAGWFRRPPWEQSLKNAYDQGTAILLHNMDPDYTSGEVEDIIWHAFTENCEAKILPRSAISSPHCYQALVLLKTKEAAQKVLAKLDEECLMLSNGRPLVATPCPPIIPRKNCKVFGHLSIARIKIKT
ncbi:hypothetical protein L1887_00241 [Cichorium endivia]|nr:hypothetical protein L1887_00241 [Cichorium endivia]